MSCALKSYGVEKTVGIKAPLPACTAHLSVMSLPFEILAAFVSLAAF